MKSDAFRRKFVLASIGLFSGLAILGFAATNIWNFAVTAIQADSLTQHIATNVESLAPSEGQGDDSISDDLVASARYFVVKLSDDGSTYVSLHHSLSFTAEEALAIAQELQGKSTGWYQGGYRYRVLAGEGATYVILLDETRELNPTYRVLYASAFGAGIIILGSVITLLPFSSFFVKKLRQNERKQKAYISNASHGLKTPLTIISANNEIEAITHGESEYTKAIAKQVGQMTEMVANLNLLAKVDEEGEYPVSDFDLSAVAEESCQEFEEVFLQQGKALHADIEPGIHLKASRTMIARLFALMLDNASKYSTSHCELRLARTGKTIRIEERNDTFVDHSSTNPSELFERFKRGDDAETRGIEGSGIGMSIIKEIVLKAKGTVEASFPDGDFALAITLPAARK